MLQLGLDALVVWLVSYKRSKKVGVSRDRCDDATEPSCQSNEQQPIGRELGESSSCRSGERGVAHGSSLVTAVIHEDVSARIHAPSTSQSNAYSYALTHGSSMRLRRSLVITDEEQGEEEEEDEEEKEDEEEERDGGTEDECERATNVPHVPQKSKEKKKRKNVVKTSNKKTRKMTLRNRKSVERATRV